MNDRIEKLAVVLAFALSITADGWYCHQAMAGVVEPTLATWMVFEVGSLLSLASYRKYDRGEHPLISNIANYMDPVIVAIVMVFVALSPKVDAHFRFWNFVCFAIAILAIVVWRATHSEVKANVVSQFVMGAGYVPMVLHLVRERRNTESFVMWTAGLAIALLLLISPIRRRNRLGILYIGRAAACVAAMLGVMLYFQFLGPR